MSIFNSYHDRNDATSLAEFDRMRESYLQTPQEFADGGHWDDPLE